MDVRQALTARQLNAEPRRNGSVVVGASPDGRSASAVVWAVQEAESTGRLVKLVTAHEERTPSPARPAHDLSVLARQLTLQQVMSLTTLGPVVPALLSAAADAELLVVGHRGMGRMARALAGGVSAQLAEQSTVPVVVVPEAWMQARFAAAPLVLGLSPDAASHGDGPEAAATEFAFARADALGVPLTVVCAWQVPPVTTCDAEATVLYEQATKESVEGRLASWTERYPWVTASLCSGGTTAADALLQAARHAQLIVVARSRRRLGSTSRAIMCHSECPVVVVPDHGVDLERGGLR
ncbi:universal stress protein [Nocardioides sp. JQ2195]|uniref:universal stress protein n=1 Tax=Nocardioides sp. JQ2195 TaxID=2592334 RepID=UPI00143E260F|nr:universal stress protein [Nocardioides sp. JQ2195]QIX26727.1 universal stress protein [Nocardioides sp. JQ2195]